MTPFPTLSEQLSWLFFLGILSLFAILVIVKKRLLVLPAKQAPCWIKGKDVLFGITNYALFNVVLGALAVKIVMAKTGMLSIDQFSLVHLLFLTLTFSTYLYYLKLRKIDLFRHSESIFNILVKVCLYLLVIFPIASLIGQICDTFLYVFFDLKEYEQTAVVFLKQAISAPLSFFCSLIAIVIMAPFNEELLFRGFILNYIRKYLGAWPAILISALLFAAVHYNPTQGLGNISLIVALAFFGVMLGAFYVMTTSLVYPILLHAVFNLISSLRIVLFDT